MLKGERAPRKTSSKLQANLRCVKKVQNYRGSSKHQLITRVTHFGAQDYSVSKLYKGTTWAFIR